MERSRTTPPPAAATASTRSLAEHDADAYESYLGDLREQLLEPPELVLCDEPRHPTERLAQITAMVDKHEAQLHRVVRRRGSRCPAIVDDACTYAWLQLLAAEHVDLRPPRWEALAWLTSCAVRYARMLNEVQRHPAATDPLGAINPQPRDVRVASRHSPS